MIILESVTRSEKYITVTFNTGESVRLSPYSDQTVHLQADTPISDLEYQHIKDEADRYGCRNAALNYLAIRARSALEMKRYLLKKKFSGEIISTTIEALKQKGLIDDYDFALRFIQSKHARKTFGANLLKRELAHKGVSAPLIAKAIKESRSDLVDIDAVVLLARQKLARIQNKKNPIPKLIYFLNQKGFDHALIKQVLTRLNESESPDHVDSE